MQRDNSYFARVATWLVCDDSGRCIQMGQRWYAEEYGSSYYGGDIPWLVIGDLNDSVVRESQTKITESGLANSSAKWVNPNSVLIAMYGSIGKLGLAAVPVTTNQAIAFAYPNEILPRYLFWYLRYQRSDLYALGKGGTQRNISQTVLKAFQFPVAPLPEQHRIVEAIETQFTRLDAAVAALERVKANLKRYRASVLKAACEGRLVPTEADLTAPKAATTSQPMCCSSAFSLSAVLSGKPTSWRR